LGFEAPTDAARWRAAQLLAATDRQVLLEEIVRVFPHPLDYIDGDRSFRRIHYLVDVFVDKNKNLVDLTSDSKLGTEPEARLRAETAARQRLNGRRLIHERRVSSLSDVLIVRKDNARNKLAESSSDRRKLEQAEKQMQQDEIPDMYKHIPPNYDFRSQGRAPIVQIGFGVWKKDSNSYFSGNRLGYSGMDRGQFFAEWNRIKDKINTPFIALCEGNENWGMLSTMFPNRTAGWGACCSTPKDKYLMDFLNHDMTLALLVNQHHNLTHPKVLTLPRGLPLTWAYTEKMVWDVQRYILQYIKKERLLFSSSSSYGKREC
jgi:hypothetical protein